MRTAVLFAWLLVFGGGLVIGAAISAAVLFRRRDRSWESGFQAGLHLARCSVNKALRTGLTEADGLQTVALGEMADRLRADLELIGDKS